MTDEARTALRADATILVNRPCGAGLRLRMRVPGWRGATPGQFLMLSPGALSAVERSDPLLPRPMAVYRQAGEEVEVLYKRVGRGTALLAEARPGQQLRVVGPLGRGFSLPPAGGEALLVGGGTGIASLYELAAAAADRCRVRVLLGGGSAEDLLGRDDFGGLAVALELATEDGSVGHRGLVTEPLAQALAANPAVWVYACGPTPMMRRCAELARTAGVARCLVSLENHMACGIGICLGCAAPRADAGYALVCRDGPVFDAAAVRWEGLP